MKLFRERGPRFRSEERPPRRSLLLEVAGMVFPVLVFLLVLPTFYYSVSPGSAEAVEDMITVEGRPRLAEGRLFLTSVSLEQLSLMGFLAQGLSDGRLESLGVIWWVREAASRNTIGAPISLCA